MAEWALIGLVAGFGVLLCVCCAALVEVFRQLAELRAATNLDDEPIPLDIRSGEFTTAHVGLPDLIAELPEAIVVFLHGRCNTCRAVAEAFRGGAPDSVWFVIPAEDLARLQPFAALAQATERVIADIDDGIASALRMEVAPAVVTTRYGVIHRAVGVSTAKQVLSLVPTTPQASAALN